MFMGHIIGDEKVDARLREEAAGTLRGVRDRC
jgi:hypothetical protein